jgi:hypothetical protein
MTKALTTLTNAFRGGMAPRLARVYLIPLDGHHGDTAMTQFRKSFQYFPSTISDSKATNYQTKVIPGLSHPLYQWTSGGARIISFQAVFSRDRTYNSTEADAVKKGTGDRGAKISLLGRSQAAYGAANSLGIASNKDPRNVDIPSAIAWLRSHLLPEYTDGDGVRTPVPKRPLPPRKLILGIPGVRLNWGIPTLPATEVNVIMTACQVTYTSFFHDGTPRIAKVSLSFAEIIQIGGKITVHDATYLREVGYGGYALGSGES